MSILRRTLDSLDERLQSGGKLDSLYPLFEAVDTLLESRVRSVTLSNSGGLLLDLDGVGSLDFSEVQQIL